MLRTCIAIDLKSSGCRNDAARLPAPDVLSGLDLSRDWSKELKRAGAER